MTDSQITRRRFISVAAAGSCSLLTAGIPIAGAKPGFKLNYLIGSSMYGYFDLKDILPEIKKAGASAIDIWPRVHGNQREQVAEMGEEAFKRLLRKNKVELGCITQFTLGAYNLQEEMRFAARMGCKTIVTGIEGKKGQSGAELRAGIADFIEKMKPHMELAEALGIHIAIENHAGRMMDTEEAVKVFLDSIISPNKGLALAPYHLPQDEEMLANQIRMAGEKLTVFYAWQHGNGSVKKQPREDEQKQLPGLGSLDFVPLLQALKEINFSGWTEIFMHSFPRGTAIMDTPAQVSEQLLRSRDYLEKCLTQL